MIIRIAMTAHSLIYAPLYRAAAILNGSPKRGVKVEFVFSSDNQTGLQKGFGDEGAYEHLCSDPSLDLCLADPLVLAEEAWSAAQRRGPLPKGEIIAVLLRRPALWALTTPTIQPSLRRQLIPGKPTKRGSVAHKLERSRGAATANVNLGRICTYDPGSTAYRIMDYMAREHHFSWDGHQQVKIVGDEVAFLEKRGSEGVDVVITCDCILPYLYKQIDDSEISVIFAWHLSRLIEDMPFTALISRRDLKEANFAKRAAIAELLREIQLVIKNEMMNGQYDEAIAESFLQWEMPSLPPSVLERLGLGGGARTTNDVGIGDAVLRDKVREIAESLLHKLRQRTSDTPLGVSGIFPEDIRPDAGWLPRAWSFSFKEVWNVPPRSPSPVEIKRCFALSINPNIAKRACPRTYMERAQAFFLDIFGELEGEGGGIAQITATAVLFLLAIACTILEEATPEGSLASRIAGIYTPELALGLILILDMLRASRRRRNRRGQGS